MAPRVLTNNPLKTKPLQQKIQLKVKQKNRPKHLV